MKLMIVDDEAIIRTGLCTVINWEELGFTLLGAAESAEQALACMQQEPPHILLTDIRMGGMDGLELSRIVKRQYPHVEIIILSGHNDFVYMQDALRGGIGDYLLKTSRPEEIIKAVLMAKQRIEERQLSAKQDEKRNRALRDQELESLLLHGHADLSDISPAEMFPALFGGSDEARPLQAAIISPSGWGNKPFYEELLVFAVQNMIGEQLACETLQRGGQLITVFRSGEGTAQRRSLKPVLTGIEQLLKCDIFTAFGCEVSRLDDLKLTYEQAQYAFGFKGIPLIGSFVSYADVAQRQGSRIVCSMEEEAELSAHLRSGDPIPLRSWIHRIVERQLTDPHATPIALNAYFNSALVCGFRWLERALHSVGMESGDLRREPVAIELAGAVEEQLFKQLQQVIATYKDAGSSDRHSYVRKAIAYIQDHLQTELSLHEVSKQVHLHPNHFSEMFHRETGSTYIEFVKQERIKRASEILVATEAKISEVAEQIGYSDIKYFTKLFKQYTGTTPSEYRGKFG